MSLKCEQTLNKPGADPGIFVRGGPTIRKIVKSKKKNKQKQTKKAKRGEGGRLQYLLQYSVFCFSMVEIYFCHWNSFINNNFYKYDIPRCFLQAKHIQGDCLSFAKCVILQGVLGVLPQNFFCLNGVKSCNFKQNKHGNGTFIKARDNCVWREKG